MKNLKGPWRVESNPVTSVIKDCLGRTVCRMLEYSSPQMEISEIEVNAKLIAGTPDLLAALEMALTELEAHGVPSEKMEFIKSAIKKVTSLGE